MKRAKKESEKRVKREEKERKKRGKREEKERKRGKETPFIPWIKARRGFVHIANAQAPRGPLGPIEIVRFAADMLPSGLASMMGAAAEDRDDDSMTIYGRWRWRWMKIELPGLTWRGVILYHRQLPRWVGLPLDR